VFINDIGDAAAHSKYLLFADNIEIYSAVGSPQDCTLLQSDINCIQGWCTANCMKRNISKTKVISSIMKTKVLVYDYKLCHSTITRADSIKDREVFIDAMLHFHDHVNFVLSQCIKLFGIFHSITFNFSSLECLLRLYVALVRYNVEYASIVWNSITSTDANKLERIQQTFVALSFSRFF
jgi:hypothetical protein